MQQRVEILKALYRVLRLLILDEPTAVLTPQEVDELAEIMRSLIRQGKSIIFITHKLREVIATDRVAVQDEASALEQVRLEILPRKNWLK